MLHQGQRSTRILEELLPEYLVKGRKEGRGEGREEGRKRKREREKERKERRKKKKKEMKELKGRSKQCKVWASMGAMGSSPQPYPPPKAFLFSVAENVSS